MSNNHTEQPEGAHDGFGGERHRLQWEEAGPTGRGFAHDVNPFVVQQKKQGFLELSTPSY